MTDIMIYESGNGGEIFIKDNGDVETTDGLFNMPYLSHFGGNVEAVTTGQEEEGEERFDWWGNTFLEENSQMNSLLEKSLNENNLSSQGRNFIERDAKTDLQSLNEIGSTDSSVSIISNDKIQVSDRIEQLNQEIIWTKTKDELIQEITI